MVGKMATIAVDAVVAMILLTMPIVFFGDAVPIPADKAQVNGWYKTNVKPYTYRKNTLDPALVTAEARPKVIKVRKNGRGDFKTVTDAVRSIPAGNTNRVIVWIGPGNYTEKITIEEDKPFVTFYGSPNHKMPKLIYSGTAAQYGMDSATLMVLSDYFTAVNIAIVNSAPRPDGKRPGAQATAFRISGDKAEMHNCKIYGFQDTVYDDKGKHFFKDCYIEGTVDFIYGNGKSLYMNTELHVVSGATLAITAQGRESNSDESGYSFIHCTVTGSGNNTFLGRAWRPFSRVVFAYSELSDVIVPQGWSDFSHPEYDNTVFYGEYKNTGPGSNPARRIKFAKQLSDADAQPFISLAFIDGSKWLLPPHSPFN